MLDTDLEQEYTWVWSVQENWAPSQFSWWCRFVPVCLGRNSVRKWEKEKKKKKVLVLNPAKLNPRHWQRWRVRTILGSPRIVGDRIHCMGELVKAKRGFCSPKEVLPRSRGSPPTRTAIKRPCLLPTSHVLSGKKHTVPRRQTLNPVSHRPSLCQDL